MKCTKPPKIKHQNHGQQQKNRLIVHNQNFKTCVLLRTHQKSSEDNSHDGRILLQINTSDKGLVSRNIHN